MSVALAVIVKTPGLSPIKTRLAQEVGQAVAESLYIINCSEIQTTLKNATKHTKSVDVFWAVAEEAAIQNTRWKSFPTIYQGTGSLGMRLDHIYRQLIGKYAQVILIGGDTLGLTPDIVRSAMQSKSEFVIGPALDGGFYLFGGRKPLPQKLWTQVKYSVQTTCRDLSGETTKLGSLSVLLPLSDCDKLEDCLAFGSIQLKAIAKKGMDAMVSNGQVAGAQIPS